MKAQEALKVIDKVHDYPCPYGIGGTAWLYIRNCIEKQMPEKPLWGATSNASWRSCPICHSRQNKTFKYCSQCGQALDWGDNE